LIVDLPPLSVSADAIELGRLLTGVIVVVAVRRTTIDELADLLRTLHAGNVRVIEVLLNEPVSKS
jgi:Mrp family chromosome partitioning ATPase